MDNQWRDNANCMVVWADGTYDRARICSECNSSECNSPVHEDRYKSLGQATWEIADAEAASGYWSWMYKNQPLGGYRDHDGDVVAMEYLTSNPDGLPENDARTSGVLEHQHDLMQGAYDRLSDAQKEVWDLVMREQLSQTEAGQRLDITQQAVEKRLSAAKLIVTEYLRSKQDDVA